jgi:hypothetical protein
MLSLCVNIYPCNYIQYSNTFIHTVVCNIKSRRTRLVYTTPASGSGGKGLIGVTIRLDDYAMAEDRLIRVLEIEESSPADIAGLHPETDYLLGIRPH